MLHGQGTLVSGWSAVGGYTVGSTGGLSYSQAYYPSGNPSYIVFTFSRPDGSTLGTGLYKGAGIFNGFDYSTTAPGTAAGVTGSPHANGDPGTATLAWDQAGTWRVSIYTSDAGGGTHTLEGSTTFVVVANTHNLTISAGGNGTIAIQNGVSIHGPGSGMYALSGTQTINVSADVNYHIKSFTVTQNGVQVYNNTLQGTTDSYTVNMAAGDAFGSATFAHNSTPVDFVVSGTTKTYNGTALSVLVQPSDPNAIYTVDFGSGPSAGRTGQQLFTGPTNASSGTYTITVTGPDSSYFGRYGTTGSWSISPAPLTFTFGNLTNAFVSTTTTFTATCSPSNALAQAGVDYSTSLNYGAAAGSYGVSATSDGKSGNFSGSGSATATVSRKAVTLSFSNTSNTYTGGNFTAAVSASDSNANSSISITAGSLTYGSNAGSYPQITAQATGNYSGSASTIPQISPKGVTWSFGNLSNQYNGGSFSASATPSDPGAASSASYSTNYGPTVGNYTVSASANGNYTGSGSNTASVTKATPTVSWSNPAAITYGTALTGIRLNATANVPGSFSYSPATGTVLHAGTRTLSVTFTPTDATNYNSAAASVTVLVNRAPLTTMANDASKVYGAALPSFGANYAGFVNGDTGTVLSGTPNFSTSATSASPVNGATGYAINVTLGTLSAADYSFATFVAGKLTVTPCTPTVNWPTPAPITYGTALGAAQLNAVAKDTNNAAVTGIYTYNPASGTVPHVGNGTIGLSVGFAAADSTDFNNTAGSNSITVTRANLTISANDRSITYGANVPALTYSITGYVNSDPPTVVTGEPTLVTAATNTSAVGSYTITTGNGTLSAADYTFTLGNGTLTITAKPETYALSNLAPTYDGTAKAPVVSASPDSAAADNATIAYTGINGTAYGPTNATPTNAGQYQVTVTGTGNYSGSTTGTMTIGKATPVILWPTPAPVVYGTALSGTQLNAIAKDVRGTPMTNGTYVYTPGSGVLDAGPQTLSVDFTPSTADAVNYNHGSGAVPLLVSKAPLTVTANDASKLYGAALPMFAATIAGFVNGDTSTAVSGSPSFSTQATAASAVGSYQITPAKGSLVATNYNFTTFTPGTLTVAKFTPTVAWSTPVAIAYGTVLGATQLNAAAKDVNGGPVSGAYTYIPPTGTILAAGNQTLNVSFVATDTIDYNASAAAPVTSSVQLTVTKGTLTATADSKTMVYGSALPTLTTSYTGFTSGEGPGNITIPRIATTATISSPVGTYPITLTGGSAANYSLTLVNGNLTVTGKPETYTIATGSLTQTYDGTPKSVTVNVTPDSAATYTVTYTGTGATLYSTSETAPTNAGTYNVNVTATGSYAGSTSGILTVNKVPLTVSASNASKVYGSANPTFSASYSGFVNGETTNVLSGTPAISTMATASSAVGSYSITPAAGTLSATNYSFVTFNPGVLTVTNAPLTVTANNTSKTYGSANPTFTATYSGFVNGDTSTIVNGSPAFSTTATTSSAVGSYQVTVALGTLAATNYTFSTFNAATLTVSKAALTATANNQSMVYGGAVPNLTYVITGYVNGDTPSVVTGTASLATTATSSSSVGGYRITTGVGTLSASNYSFSAVDGMLTVTPAALTVTANNQTKLYGSTNPALTYTFSGFKNGEMPSVVSGNAVVTTPATTSSSAGSYSITPALGTLAAANYSFGPFVNGTLRVTPAPISVVANDASKIYGAANPTFTASYSGFVNGDTPAAVVSGSPTFTTTATTSSAVGSYSVMPALGTLTATNYSFGPFVPGALTITKAALTVTANDQTKVYGALNPTLTYLLSGFVNGDPPTVVTGVANIATAATSSSAVGSYPITAAVGTLSATNYSFGPFVAGTLMIAKAALTVTADNQSKVYGSANPNLTASYSGFAIGDTSASITQPTIATAATAASGVGSYTITLTGGSAPNYALTLVNGTLAVTKAPLTVTANDGPKTYGAANPDLTYAFSGFVNNDTSNVVSGAATVSTTATASSSVGSYTITPAIGTLTAPNYSFGPFVNGTLTVNKAALTATANNQTKAYGAENPILTISYSGFVNGDTSTSITQPAIATTATNTSPVGLYAITLTGGSATNYDVSLVAGTFTITAKPITFTFSNLSYVFDGTQKTATAIPSDLAATYTSDLVKGPDAHSYAVSATATGNYSGSGTAMLVIAAKPVTFTFGNLAYVYDGQPHSATVACSDPAATFTADLTKGPTANTYAVTASAAGNYTGSGADNLVISPASQVITLTPSPTANVFAGQPVVFTAAGGANGYTWAGNAGATGTSGSVTLTFLSPGTYALSVSNDASTNYTQSNTMSSIITVTSNHVVNSLTPVASSFTVNDANSPMNGQSYGRLWNDGGWTAYLGRSGVKFEVQAQAYPAVKAVELQAKQPGGNWVQLALNSPVDGVTAEDVTFSVMLDGTVPGQPLVPLSYSTGNPLTGTWSFRARVQDANGGWSDFSPEVQVNAILPIVTKTLSGQTVPPAGPLGDWFTASSVKTFSIPLWVP